MRLWHYQLIPYLDRQRLLGQWHECCLIAKNIKELGTPNHILVNKIMDYPIGEFITYGMIVEYEMRSRGYKVDKNKFLKYFDADTVVNIRENHIFEGWHNERYLTICFWNLYEKYWVGGMTNDEWKKILS